MFDNISQALVGMGGIGYMVAVPILDLIAKIFMMISIYKILKLRKDKHMLLWLAATFISPIIARIVYEIYIRAIAKNGEKSARGSLKFLVISLIASVLSIVITVVSVFSIGLGFIKSGLDGEPLLTVYDVYGNEYHDKDEIPLYDKEGNVYTHHSEWFTAGYYTDESGKRYESDFCYLSEEGFFHYFPEGGLVSYKGEEDYYTDGETVYFALYNRVYWEEDGTMFYRSGRFDFELFDFD